MEPIEQRQCLHCHRLFTPNARNVNRQKFCSAPACKKASKTESQRRWSSNNPDYFKGIANVSRVQEWRRTHPNSPRAGGRKSALQDGFPANPSEPKGIPSSPVEISPPQQVSLYALQDSVLNQHLVLIGIIAHFGAIVLQEDIDKATRYLSQLGQNVINGLPIKPQGGPENDKHVNGHAIVYQKWE